jgi:hypothetical protein
LVSLKCLVKNPSLHPPFNCSPSFLMILVGDSQSSFMREAFADRVSQKPAL